ncbi:MAG: valyl-tRNA synthetase [Candidatus Paceibacteria bacterium]|jgi:valyl-tRNA synthetase
MNDKFLKPYEPQETESRIYKIWEESGLFNPDKCIEDGHTSNDAETFSIVLPPPNVTGNLHMGHASMLAIQDIMVRYNRMKGKQTLWIPGTDHAAIATQSKVEKLLSKEKVRRQDLGREKFLKKVEEFASDSHNTIVGQIRSMGASVDWSREAYTLDDERSKAVRKAFKDMHDDDLIYQGDRIVNWDPKGQTTISDDEVVRVDETTKFYYLKYGPFVIGTSRPETKFGDKYVVMHPEDKRYTEYKEGQEIELEWINGPIKATIIKDISIDMEFGTGVMTITPWHDSTDFDIAERHGLDKEQIIDKYGKLLPVAEEFEGMKITEAREKIIGKLESKGLVEKIDDKYEHSLATAERTGGIIEPQIMRQWFVAVDKKFKMKHSEINGIAEGQEVTLKELMLHTIKSDQINIIPERFEKVYFNWIENLRDWCISRQIWYGHRIPVWYKGNDITVGEEPSGDGWEQDEDTLDTWFSSGLWTFTTLGWPENTEDFKKYHPTNILETGYDIIFFWVARMILMSTYHTGQIPFKTTYLHGLVKDPKGKKMSKSLGNIVDPLDMIEKYGTDAVRLSLIVGIGPGNDSNLSEEKIKAYKKFSNKIWNASRFVVENTEGISEEKPTLHEQDQKYIDEFETVLKEISGDIESYKFYLAGEKLYHYFWHTFADVIIEDTKNRMDDSAKWTLYYLLTNLLKVLHPFTPFITEEIWSLLPYNDKKSLLMVEKWPT